MKTSYLPSTLAQVRDEVEALPAEERSALMLVCVQGLSYQEAARELGLPLQSVRKHLLGARLALMRGLGMAGDGGWTKPEPIERPERVTVTSGLPGCCPGF